MKNAQDQEQAKAKAKADFYAGVNKILGNYMEVNMAIDRALVRLGRKKVSGSGKIRDAVIAIIQEKSGYQTPDEKTDPKGFDEFEKVRSKLFIQILNFRHVISTQSKRLFGPEGDSYAGHTHPDD